MIFDIFNDFGIYKRDISHRLKELIPQLNDKTKFIPTYFNERNFEHENVVCNFEMVEYKNPKLTFIEKVKYVFGNKDVDRKIKNSFVNIKKEERKKFEVQSFVYHNNKIHKTLILNYCYIPEFDEFYYDFVSKGDFQ